MTGLVRAPVSADLPFWRMVMYGLPALPTAFLYLPLPLLIPPFYAAHLGLSLTTIGVFLLFAKLFDMVIDPMLGRLSDITKSRWGRRRPWMVIGTPIMMVGTALVFLPPAHVTGWYLMFASMVIYFGASMTGLAYSAWGAEIVETYHGRSKLAGVREFCTIFGTLLAAAIPALTARYGHDVDRFTIAILGWTAIVLMPICLFAALRWVPEPPRAADAREEAPWLDTLRELWGNIPFRFLCGGFVLTTVGNSVASACLIFYVTYYLRAPALVGPVLIVSFMAVLLFVPVWVRIARRIGKHRAVAYSLILSIIASSLLTFQLRPGDGIYFVVLVGFLGAAASASMTLPVAMMGDVIDYDALRTGSQRGGVYFGVWAFAQQIAPGLAIGATLPLLEWLGFRAGPESTQAGLDWLRIVYCFGPLPFLVVGAALLLRFPIDARRHAVIRRRLDVRLARRHAVSSGETCEI